MAEVPEVVEEVTGVVVVQMIKEAVEGALRIASETEVVQSFRIGKEREPGTD